MFVGTLDENGAKCISLLLSEAGTNKEEFGEFLFKKDGGAQLDLCVPCVYYCQ